VGSVTGKEAFQLIVGVGDDSVRPSMSGQARHQGCPCGRPRARRCAVAAAILVCRSVKPRLLAGTVGGELTAKLARAPRRFARASPIAARSGAGLGVSRQRSGPRSLARATRLPR
jgi:hypothetical protein